MRWLLLTGCLLVAPAAAAQNVEIGGTVGAGCLGSDGTPCGAGTNPMVGGHVSWWIDERIELTARAARLPLEPFGLSVSIPAPVSAAITRRSRDFVSGLATYHFRRGKRIQPMLGFGSGGFARAQHVRCDPPGCAGLAGLPLEGRRRTWMTDAIVVAGLSGTVGDRWRWRSGLLTHRFANDENSTLEYFVGFGRHFGSR